MAYQQPNRGNTMAAQFSSAQTGLHSSTRPLAHGAFRWVVLAAAAAAVLLTFTSPRATAAILVVDDFAAPAAPTVNSLSAVGDASFNDSTATVLGGQRGVYHHVYTNPLGNTATLSVGAGVLSSTTGADAQTEVLVSYGAFTRPTGDPALGGPLLGLDSTPYNAFRFDFTSISSVLNINVIMYTSNPLNPLAPLYYSTVGVNVAPLVPGGPLIFDLPFYLTDPFNYGQVDGIVFLINRANDATGISYVLNTFSLVTAVPEPAPVAMWVAGLGALVWLRKRRQAAV
jgi:hypothetical protein